MAHHADVSQALLLAIATAGIDGRIYNVADDAPMSFPELKNLFVQVLLLVQTMRPSSLALFGFATVIHFGTLVTPYMTFCPGRDF